MIPVSDDDDLLCYEGVIDNKKVLFIDCKKSVDRTIPSDTILSPLAVTLLPVIVIDLLFSIIVKDFFV